MVLSKGQQLSKRLQLGRYKVLLLPILLVVLGAAATSVLAWQRAAAQRDAENLFVEIDNSLVDGLSDVLKAGDLDGTLTHYHPDFRGWAPKRQQSKALKPGQAVTCYTWDVSQGTSVDRDGLRKAWRNYLNNFSHLSVVYLHFKDGEVGGWFARRVKGRFTVAFTGRTRRGEWVEDRGVMGAEFVKVGDTWQILSQWPEKMETVAAPVRQFTEATASVGLSLAGPPAELVSTFAGELDHGGLAVDDYNRDGYLDLYVCRPRGLPNVLYENRGGRFVEVTARANVGDRGDGRTALFFDYNNDGWPDLFVANLYWSSRVPNRLYRNNKDGTFTDVTKQAGLEYAGSSYAAAAADYDGDGDLDLYVGNYGQLNVVKNRPPQAVGYGSEMFVWPNSFVGATNGEPNLLYRNNGDGTFTEIGRQAGVADTGWTLAVGWADYNNDGAPDLFVANDYGEKRLYRNNKNGTFTDVAKASGALDPGFGMSVSWGDYDNDGNLDIYAGNMSSNAGTRITKSPGYIRSKEKLARFQKGAGGNTLLRNNGDGTFTNVTAKANVGRAGWVYGSEFFDLDNDGLLDIYVANGFYSGASKKDY